MSKYYNIEQFINSFNSILINHQNKVIDIVFYLTNPYLKVDKDNLIFVAGCGSGLEAALIAKKFNSKVIAVDINLSNDDIQIIDNLEFQKQDLMKLPYKDNEFSMIYSYHVLEHVESHIEVLKEFNRILKQNGVLFIGFPNKNRMIGYIGSSAKLIDKFKWNINDFKNRLIGRFENRYGAHAGFSEKEFICDAEKIFKKIIPVRIDYMKMKYPNYSAYLNIIVKLGLENAFLPSNYYICIK